MRRDRGSASVEFALVMPLLLVVALAILQVGLLLRDQLVIVQVARVAAREAAVTPSDEEVRLAAVDAAAGLDPDTLVVEVERAGTQGGSVAANVRVAWSGRVPLVGWLVPQDLTLHARSVMRQEFP